MIFHFLGLGIIFSSSAALIPHPKLVNCTFELLASNTKLLRLWLYEFVLKGEKSNGLLIIVIVQMQFMYCDSASCATFAFFLVLPFFLHDSPSKPYFIRYSLKSSFLLRDSLRSLFLFCHTWFFRLSGKLREIFENHFPQLEVLFSNHDLSGLKSFLGFSSQLNSQEMLCGM